MPSPTNRPSPKARKRGRIGAMALVLAVLAATAAGAWGFIARVSGSRADAGRAVYEVRRGDLLISVMEAGTIRAARSVEIQSEVSGQRRIISVVDEGYEVTPEDVANRKILVELDASDLEDRVAQQESSYQSAKASWTDAQESLAIRQHQNDSNIMRAEMAVRFARADVEKHLGAELAAQVLAAYEEGEGEMDLAGLAESPILDGAALQQLRRRQADIDLAREELSRAQDRLEWTRRLYEAKQVSRNDLEADQLALQRRENALAEAKTALNLFLAYDFPQQTERLLADVIEKDRELERTQARARSEIAQAEGNLLSREANYRLQRRRREEALQELENCVIYATQPGMVVYASSVARRWRGDPIEPGAMVRQRQSIITLPDVSEMAVTVRVHEAFADRVRPGQRALIATDAFPDRALSGRVRRIGVLPEPQGWLSTGVNVYATDVTIEGNHRDALKPGMSARVEIIVAELKDVLYIPIQAVTFNGGDRLCYVATDGGYQARTIQTGLFNERFIEVKEGLEEGERVLLYPPSPEATGGVPGRERPAERQNDLDAPDGGGAPPAAPDPAAQAPSAAPEGESAQPRERRGRRPEGGAGQGDGAQRPAGQRRRPAGDQP